MNNIETLLSKRWVLKSEDRDRYYKIKDNIKELRLLFKDKIGYSLISHPQYIRLDKIPGKGEPWMGINDFKNIMEYEIFCYMLVFLEDKEIEEQFILSHLTEFIQVQLNKEDDFWLKFTNRKMFVNVLKYCIKEKLIVQDDGNSDSFVQDNQVEVLFENTGLSRYFMRNFTMDIFEIEKPSEFMQSEWLNENQRDRGAIRRQRIYRRLLLSPGIYRENDEIDDDFSYIRNRRKRIESDFNQLFSCDLQVYNSSAYLVLEDNIKIGSWFPKSNALDELVVICCGYIREKINKSLLDKHEIFIDNKDDFFKKLNKIISKQIEYLPATYRQYEGDKLIMIVYGRFKEIGFVEEINNEVYVYPVVAKLSGSYEEK